MLESATRTQLVVSMRKVLMRYVHMGSDADCMRKTHICIVRHGSGLAMLSPHGDEQAESRVS